MDYQVAGDIYPEGMNPYNLAYSPGGSTGGGAAALAAGFTPLELGADFGGSIRVPSNFCGLYGMKPTEKTVPSHGNNPLAKNANTFILHMAQAGPLARTLDDVELLWKTILGPHESERSVPAINWQDANHSLTNFKIAWTDGWPGFGTSSQTSHSIESLADKLRSHGCHIEKRIPDDTIHQDSLKVFTGLFPYIIAQGTPWFIRAIMKRQLYSGFLKGIKKEFPDFSKSMNDGFRLRANHYGQMMLQRNLLIQRWENFFNHYDFLICPVAFGPAYKRSKIGEKIKCDGKEMIYIKYTWPYVACFNATGNPSITIPLGLGEDGLPIGVQVVGAYWSEPKLLDFAKKIAPLTEGFVKPEGY